MNIGFFFTYLIKNTLFIYCALITHLLNISFMFSLLEAVVTLPLNRHYVQLLSTGNKINTFHLHSSFSNKGCVFVQKKQQTKMKHSLLTGRNLQQTQGWLAGQRRMGRGGRIEEKDRRTRTHPSIANANVRESTEWLRVVK